MYGWLWRHLPGPALLRVLVLLVLAGVALWACFQYLFPWIAPFMPFNDTTVGE
jgi:hypothetical protein